MSIKRFQKNDIEGYCGRLDLFRSFLIICLIVIIVRIWYLQVIEGNNLKKEADNNRIRTISEPGIRGNIFDRNGIPIVFNRPSFTAQLILENISEDVDKGKLINKICNILDIPQDIISAKVKSFPKLFYFQPIILKKNLDRESLAYLEEHKEEIPGVESQFPR